MGSPGPPKAAPYAHLLKGFPELAAGGHAQLLGNVGRHLQQQHLHEAGHESVLWGDTHQCWPPAARNDSDPTRAHTAPSARGALTDASPFRAPSPTPVVPGHCPPPPCTHLPHGLLQLLQADLLGLAQQRPLVHLEHGHSVLAQLHDHHVRLHLPDGLQGPWRAARQHATRTSRPPRGLCDSPPAHLHHIPLAVVTEVGGAHHVHQAPVLSHQLGHGAWQVGSLTPPLQFHLQEQVEGFHVSCEDGKGRWEG